MIVMKFGGTSVADPPAVRRITGLIRDRLGKRPAIVVSALSGVTDALYRLCEMCMNGSEREITELVSSIRDRHMNMIHELISAPEYSLPAEEDVEKICGELELLSLSACHLGELSDRTKAKIISCGEYLSSRIIHRYLNAERIRTAFADARKMIITDDEILKGNPDMDAICSSVPATLREAGEDCDAVITQGFVSSDSHGHATVLGRGGSDYTASMIGMAINAEEIEIWTDVDGVHTSDPRKVKGTRSLSHISFEEAAEMAHFGAKVLHPSTIEPAIRKNIPIKVLNSMKPEASGTTILQDSYAISSGAKSISCKENIIVINIFSTKMINTFGFLNKVFEIFGKYHVPVDLISTSEANVSITLENNGKLDEIVRELSGFAEIRVENDKAQISVIGKEVTNIKGMFRKIFGSLLDYKIYMISQGASGINISFVIDRNKLHEIMNILHKELFENEGSN